MSLALAIAGVIHLVPLSGALGADRLAALYGLTISEPSLVVLMRHRAVLFGLLGAFMLFAAIRPALQSLALVAGFVSVLSFFWIAWSTGSYNDAVARIVAVDVVALVSLVFGTVAHVGKRA